MRNRFALGIALGACGVFALATGVVAYRANGLSAAASAELVRTKNVELTLERTLSLVRDAETGQRNYLLTHRTEYLGPYQSALSRLDAQLSALSTLLRDDRAGLRSLEELRALVQVKTDELARSIELASDAGTPGALAEAVTDTGRFAMDEIGAAIGRMQDREERRLSARLAALESSRLAFYRASAATTALTLASLVWLGVLLRRARSRWSAREQRLSAALHSIGDAVITTDERGLVTMGNALAERLSNTPLREARGKPFDEAFTIVDQESRARIDSPVRAALRDRDFVTLSGRSLLIGRDGEETPIEGSAAPIADGNRVIGVVVAFRDATAARAAEQAARDADRRRDEFLAVLAHELRNPLAPIRQATRVARSPSATPEQINWSHEIIERQVSQMGRLLDDLLDVSRIKRGTLEVRRSRVELGSIVSAAVEMSRALIDARRHSLRVEVAKTPMPLDADPLRIAQVLGNLLTNAAKYTQPGGHIRLTAEPQGSMAVVQIMDDGIGLTREALRGLFDMFVQIAPPLERAEGGLGIGLALSRGLVELHGGTIEARSPGPGHGSAFTVKLPLAAEERDTEHRAPRTPSRGRKELKILVADDNQDAAKSLAMLLELAGHVVYVVHDGAAALTALARFRPDVALLDIGMPSLNGYEIAERVRAHDWGDSITLVAVTGWGQDADRDRALAAGFDDHWVKPIEPTAALELCAATAAALEQRD